MDILLTADIEKFIHEQMATGLYNSVNEIFQEAIMLLINKKNIPPERINQFNSAIEEGLKDYYEGRVLKGDNAFNKLMAKYE